MCAFRKKGMKFFMADLNQIELQNIRVLVQFHEINYNKLTVYSSQAKDAQMKQIFNKLAQEELNTRQKLLSYLNT